VGMKLNNKARLADLSLIGVAMIWGAGFIAVQYAIEAGFPTSLMLAFRFLLGALVVFLFNIKRMLVMDMRELKVGIIAGALLFFSFFTQTVGQAHSSISSTAFITAIYVVLVPFFTWMMTKKRPTIKMFVLVFITLIGVLVLTYHKGMPIFSLTFGNIIVLMAACGFAVHIAYLGTHAQGMDTIKLTFLQLLTAGILGAGFYFFDFTKDVSAVNWAKGLVAVIYLGIFSTAICYLLQTWAQSITTPSRAAIMMSAESLFGSLFSILFGFELFRINLPIGGALIMLCVILSEVSFFGKLRKS